MKEPYIYQISLRSKGHVERYRIILQHARRFSGKKLQEIIDSTTESMPIFPDKLGDKYYKACGELISKRLRRKFGFAVVPRLIMENCCIEFWSY